MADDTLSRIAAIVDRLSALAAMTPGTPLKSNDWNALVASVSDLAKVALAREQAAPDTIEARFALRDHTHVAEVNTTWFDAATADLLDRSGLGGPELQSTLRGLNDKVTSLRADLTSATDQLRKFQLTVDGVRDNDAAHAQAQARIEGRLDGLQTLQDSFTSLQTRFAGLGDQLTQVLGFRAQLVDTAGQPINVAALAASVADLGGLRDSLRSADGSILTARAVEARLGTLEAGAVTRDDLDRAIGQQLKSSGVLDSITANVLDKANAATGARLAETNARIDALTTESGAAETRLGAHDATLAAVGTRLDTDEAQLGRVGVLASQVEGMNVRLGQAETVGQANSAGLASLAPLAGQIAALGARVSAVEPLGVAVQTLQTQVGGLTTEVGRIANLEQRMTGVEALQATVASLTTRLGAVEVSLADVRTTLTKVGSRITVVESEADDAANRLKNLEGGVGTLQTDVRQLQAGAQRLQTSVTQLETGVQDLQRVAGGAAGTLGGPAGGILAGGTIGLTNVAGGSTVNR